ncbi:isopenicillin N synthase family oxygenase [Paucibacter sp. O1-1]|uniref:isopenicillin N synthase family dioxygenase n=1 Tax=Paucibacter sp. M5-1 TaxID=3015998 RepID=UPI0021D50D93|nr:2OG-Fe(II) oxygenase family protein [Paucibacter sp. M5-1]MCU7371493.1 isopenicillin N synthase family oxygenase [Paucibacter sp. O1-1]MCZ7883354.1 isopenicillin N synthase family oxygenase [Paucibacter sp. M5-1]MDA3826482.1 isopenicillin N synthase family oxygenase [Paucibacter sp. O1-1]
MQVKVVDYRAADAAEQFTRSLHETGFGVLVNHPIQQALVEKIYADWLGFFNGDEKHQYAFSKEKQDGYFSTEISETAKGFTQKDIKEYFHIYPWGRIPAPLKDDAMQYYSQANGLAQELLSWVERYTPAEIARHYREPLSQMIQDSQLTLLRVLRYPPLTGNEPAGSLRAAPHGDINLLTILPAANEPGLQVQGKDGEWFDVPCDFGMLIINIGDMLQEASQGYYPSTQHRVVNPTGDGAKKSRVSLPLFLHPRDEVVLSDRYTAHAYLEERLRELGVKK